MKPITRRPQLGRAHRSLRRQAALLFTATPFREDGKSLPGRTIFRFPLREAQKDNYFTRIDYKAVLSLEGTDRALAELAVQKLRNDLAERLDHILMARGRSVRRAEELLKLYEELASDLQPAVLHDRLNAKKRKAVLDGLWSRDRRIVVCVDMLGEGFDLPSLKIAALHDVKKSLSPMIQFIGRFSRSASATRIGAASVFVAQDPTVALSPLRHLLREDADWNTILHDVTERATAAVEQLSDFDAAFTGVPDEVAGSVLQPKISAVARMYGQMCAAVIAIGRQPRGRAADLMIAATAAANRLPLYTSNPNNVHGLDQLVEIVALPRPTP